MIEVLTAPPYAAVQDLGFPAGRAWGLPPSGAMDPLLLRLANELVGNAPEAAAIECALGPAAFRCDRPTPIAVLGPATILLNDRAVEPSPLAFVAPARRRIGVIPGEGRRFSYVAVGGGIAVPQLLGSRSTYLPGGFGGFLGRRLRPGDRLPVGEPAVPRELPEVLAGPVAPRPRDDLIIRVTRGPQWERFAEAQRAVFFAGRYRVAATSDRMGYRLDGPAVRPRDAANAPSEAACPGAVQIPDGGQPIVLMPDGPTVGGYPKLAVVIRADLRLLAQCPAERPGAAGIGVRFREVSLEQARACYPGEGP